MHKKDYTTIFMVASGFVAAILTGYWRYAALAHHLGVGQSADIYLVAFAIPEFALIALPIILPPVFIPLFIQYQHADANAAWKFGVQTTSLVVGIMFIFSLVALLTAPWYLSWLAPGFDEPALRSTVKITRLMLPSLSLIALSTMISAVLQGQQRFVRPAYVTALYNLTFVMGLQFLPFSIIERAAGGVLMGACAMVALQLPFLWSRDMSFPTALKGLSPAVLRGLLNPRLKNFIYRVLPMTLGYLVHHIIHFVDQALATTLAVGSVAALNYAYHLALIIGQLSGNAISQVFFPQLTQFVADGDLINARLSLRRALRLVGWVAGPLTGLLIILREPIITVLFEHGAFGTLAIKRVQAPLVAYALAMLADALCQPLWRVIYVQSVIGLDSDSAPRKWLVFNINAIQTTLRVLANLILIPILGYNGLAYSALLGLWVQLFILSYLTRKYLST